MRRLALASALAILGAPQNAWSQDAVADVLHVTGQATALPGANTRAGGVEWLHPLSETATLDLGLFSGSGGGAWWTYARAGGVSRHERVILSAMLDLGGGRVAGAPFPYRRLQGGVIVPLGTRRVFAEGEALYVRMSTVATYGLRAGTVVQWTPRLAIRASGHVLRSGSAVSPAVSARADLTRTRWQLMGGGFVSRQAASMPLPIEGGSVVQATRGAFVGAQVRAGRQHVMATVDISQQLQGRVTTLLMGVRIPIE
ncbi:MAG: hypothetical protein ACRD09_01750 [Vicinamibacterales bacterium]